MVGEWLSKASVTHDVGFDSIKNAHFDELTLRVCLDRGF